MFNRDDFADLRAAQAVADSTFHRDKLLLCVCVSLFLSFSLSLSSSCGTPFSLSFFFLTISPSWITLVKTIYTRAYTSTYIRSRTHTYGRANTPALVHKH